MVTNEIALSRDYSLQATSVNRRKVLPSEPTNPVTNTNEQFNVYVHRNESHVYHTNVFDADNIYKKNSPNVISPICFDIFISVFGSTHDSADC